MIALVLELVIAFFISSWVNDQFGIFWAIVVFVIIMGISNSAFKK
ncbi:hypothetical protein EV195_104170 [Tenacibaculum skagerrakense]|uniref:Uncharacterized protein n=1 Tax=Tenacibaculum skagerrakense TaxID=186571 RepID=A0A4R2NTF6_9FLAO|nr:hypothetical protein EV195_104170 [Tenacibaculum skagerrakense]